MPWKSRINAEIYDSFIREGRIYDWLNERIVGLADLPGADRILDLACGTGATTLACLPAMDPRASIVGIDASAEMVSVARANVHDPRARFEVGSAAEADRLGGRFDRVICNAAFWQFPAARAVFEALSRVTGPRAGLAFNVPADRVSGEPVTIHPFQVSLIRSIEEAKGSSLDISPATVDLANLEADGAEHGFELKRIERLSYRGRQGELMELMSIPAMIEPLTPELDPAGRRSVLKRAFEQSDPDDEVIVPWIFLSFERAGT